MASLAGLAVEEAINKLLEEDRVCLCLVSEVSVLIATQMTDYTIDGQRVKDTESLVDSTVLL